MAGTRIFALDLPGHGKSGGYGQQSIPAYARSVLDWLEAVDLHQAVFVGHSMGSAIALSLALDYPEHVFGLGLIGAGPRLRVHPEILQNSASERTFHSAVALVIRWSFSSQAPARLVELSARRMAETRPSVLHGDFLACEAFDVAERLAEIIQPALVVCGAEDRMTPARAGQLLIGSLPNARLEIIPNAGHMVMLEQPKGVATTLKTFLDEI
jgi:pimeloyl-ACP methyl ester carboxylesterase